MLIFANLSKILIFILHLLKLGGGTSLPGLILEKYFPNSLRGLTKRYEKIVLISGTNGKTTTQQLLRHILEKKGLKVVSNISGANLLRGIITSIVLDCNIFGRPRSKIAVFEVEEATMPIITKYIQANFIIVTNLFRDQLDAYGEIIKTRSYIQEAIKNSSKATLILNGDDKNVCSLASEVSNKAVFFSIRDKRKKDIFFERKYFRTKDVAKKEKIYAKYIKVNDDLSTKFNVYGFKKPIRGLVLNSPGLQNIYSGLAAICAAKKIKRIGEKELILAFSDFSPAFGRGEKVRLNGKSLRILLIKNPASFTANLNMLKSVSGLKLLIVINDKVADGRDVSWLWDSNVELLKNSTISWITVSGIRAKDMLLRLKYADIDLINIETEENINAALSLSLAKLRDGETLYILPTYTAMLDVRKAIGNITNIKEFWKV